MKDQIVNAALNIQGWMSRADLDALYDLAQEYITLGGCMIEIGCWKGRSSYVFASVCQEKGAVLHAIDTFRGVEDPDSYKNKPENTGSYYEALVNPEFYKMFLHSVRGFPVATLIGDSQEIHEHLPNGIFDMCFIDGNHNSPAIDNDITNYLPKIRPGGILCGHDHGNPEGDVHTAVARLIGEQYKDWFLQIRPGVCTSIWCKVV